MQILKLYSRGKGLFKSADENKFNLSANGF